VIDEVGPDVRTGGQEIESHLFQHTAQHSTPFTRGSYRTGSLPRWIPDDQTFEQAAATWAAFGTAWAGLISVGNLKNGDTVLISAASSSVGSLPSRLPSAWEHGQLPLLVHHKKSDKLLAHGAAAALAVEEVDVVQQVKELTGARELNLFSIQSVAPAFSKLAEATATGGTLILYGALSADPRWCLHFRCSRRDLTIRGFAFPAVVRNDEPLEAVKRFVSEVFQATRLCRQSPTHSH